MKGEDFNHRLKGRESHPEQPPHLFTLHAQQVNYEVVLVCLTLLTSLLGKGFKSQRK